ncbi:MAG: hypothetical protein AAB425_01260 [Bdellovibrionota bacterium]
MNPSLKFVGIFAGLAAFLLCPRHSDAKNFLNIYAAGGVNLAQPLDPSSLRNNGLGYAGGALFDFRMSPLLSWEIGLSAIQRQLQISDTLKTWNYIQIAPLVRVYPKPEFLSFGLALYYAKRATSDPSYRDTELGGLVSVRLELDLFSLAKIFSGGIFVETRAGIGPLSSGSGTSVISADLLGLAGLRFGFI